MLGKLNERMRRISNGLFRIYMYLKRQGNKNYPIYLQSKNLYSHKTIIHTRIPNYISIGLSKESSLDRFLHSAMVSTTPICLRQRSPK